MAAVLIGSFRKAEAGDPDIFVKAIIRIFTGYSVEIVRAVCDPLNGLPSRLQWLPTIAEVKGACDAQAASYARMMASADARAKQIAERYDGPSVEVRNMLAKRAKELTGAMRGKASEDALILSDEQIAEIGRKPFSISPALASKLSQEASNG